MHQTLPPGLSYTIAITNEKAYPLIIKIVENKERQYESKFETKIEAKTFVTGSCIFILQNHDVKSLNGFSKIIFNKDNPYELSTTIFALIKFLTEFNNDNVSDLEIIMGENDLEGFRLASFIASYCQTKNKKITIRDTTQKIIPLLYGTHVQKASLLVLYSIIGFRFKNGRFPNFNELKNYHYGTAKTLVAENGLETRKNRVWSSPTDSKFVSSLYAAERNLEKEGLITKHKHETERMITRIEPTLNGFLSVVFSDLGEKLL